MDIKKHIGWTIEKYVSVRGGNNLESRDDIITVIEVKNEIVAVVENEGQLIFIVVGSNDWKDWVLNFLFRKRIVPYNGKNRKLKVHNGFYKGYQLLREKIHMYIKHKGIDSIMVMGQSHGAAVATLMAVDIQYNFPEIDLGCLLTGSPRVGNKVFVESYNRRVPNTMMFRYGNDPVARLPFKFMGYKHVAKEIPVNKVKKCKFLAVKDHILSTSKAKEFQELFPV